MLDICDPSVPPGFAMSASRPRYLDADHALDFACVKFVDICFSNNKVYIENDYRRLSKLAMLSRAREREKFDKEGYIEKIYLRDVDLDFSKLMLSFDNIEKSNVLFASVNDIFHVAVWPPYLRFMITAAMELKLTDGSRLSKDEIVGWLKDNWPSSLGKPSVRKISSAATLLRRPEDEKGGYFKTNKETGTEGSD